MSMPATPPPDDRAERMVEDPRAYFADARGRAEAEVASRPPQPRREFHGMPRSRPAPGVVQVEVTGASDEDVTAFVAGLRADGYRVWSSSRKVYERRDGTVFRFYSVELKQQ